MNIGRGDYVRFRLWTADTAEGWIVGVDNPDEMPGILFHVKVKRGPEWLEGEQTTIEPEDVIKKITSKGEDSGTEADGD